MKRQLLVCAAILLAACGETGTEPPRITGLRGNHEMTHLNGQPLPVTVVFEGDTATVLAGVLEFENDSTVEMVRLLHLPRSLDFVSQHIRYRKQGNTIEFLYGPPFQSMVSVDTGTLTSTTLTVREKYWRADGSIARTATAVYRVP